MKTFNIDNFLKGTELYAYKYFGAHRITKNGIKGIVFRVYAPMAKEVYLIGDFNSWGQYNTKLEKVHFYGVFEIFVPNVKDYSLYKYRIIGVDGSSYERMDPYEFMHELRPQTCSKVFPLTKFSWEDQEFLENRTPNKDKPMSIFEVHLGSFKKPKDREYFSYEEMIDVLIPYLLEYGFTHVEFMPLTFHPFDGSWGYQVLGFFSVDSRYGNPNQLKMLINALHKNNIGVILDFVPLHFATDAYGLLNFDGSALYEYSDDQKFSPWGSAQFDLGKDPVRSFLMSSLNYFFREFHFDGARIDAVSNIIYYSGSKERGVNNGALEFIKRCNFLIKKENPSIMMIAEDSSDYKGVTQDLKKNGLGFDYKWDLGWMNDTLKYYASDPLYRQDLHGKFSFSMIYFYNENFVLPFSHDEVVHGKKSIMNKMFGDYDQRFDQVRNLFVYQFAHPGKKLNFMGNELAVWDEWNPERQFPNVFEQMPKHVGVRRLLKDLNEIYKKEKALFAADFCSANFFWLRVWADKERVFVFERFYGNSHIICVINNSSNLYDDYEIELRNRGILTELINSDNQKYQGNTPQNECGKKYKTHMIKKEKTLPHGFKICLKPFMAAIYRLEKKEN